MLMMHGRFGVNGKPSAADAHDARPVWGLMAKPSAADAQLMLMMHGRFGG